MKKNNVKKIKEEKSVPVIECVTCEQVEFTTCSPGCCAPVEDCSPCDE